MTQEELADILNISPQSVSKWETGNSIPDVELLPIIARYFGISMDELFNYKLDSLNYKERFIRFMVDNGVLKFGKFKLHSGRISPYIINSSNYKTSSQITKLGQFYAECIRENNLEWIH
ncbi:MAG: helix-turn-helix domain-containing protein [Anaeroplasma sp.]